MSDGIYEVPAMSDDPRVRVFRRAFTGMKEFGDLEVDSYVVLSQRYAVLLDTLLCPEDMQQLLSLLGDSLQGRTLLVVNSHSDWDHAWGNAFFTGEHFAPIISHELCPPRLLAEEARTLLADYQSRYPLFSSVALHPPTITFQTSLTLYGGDLTLELFSAPGHHSDHLAAWLPEIRLLLAFDAAEKPIPILDGPTGVAPMLSTLEHFLTLAPRRVLCSHGRTTDVACVEQNLAYLREVERRCHTLLQSRRPSEAELEQPSRLIDFPLIEVAPEMATSPDREFYSWAHDHNLRSVLQWLPG